MRLIDADALIKEIHDIFTSYEEETVKRALQYAPTADVVAVVRCKDCKHYGFTENRIPQEQVWWCYKWFNVRKEMDFCSYGEIK